MPVGWKSLLVKSHYSTYPLKIRIEIHAHDTVCNTIKNNVRSPPFQFLEYLYEHENAIGKISFVYVDLVRENVHLNVKEKKRRRDMRVREEVKEFNSNLVSYSHFLASDIECSVQNFCVHFI